MAELDLSYLGSAPIKDANETAAHSAIELLLVKLDKLQKKMVDKVVEKKHGTRLSPASPVYQKIADKLRKQGLDCTEGDAVKFVVKGADLNLIEAKTDQATTLPLAQLVLLSVLPAREEGFVVLAIIQKNKQGSITCHGLRCTPAAAEDARVTLVKAIETQAKAGVTREKTTIARASQPGDGTITFGIGLHRKSSMRVSGKVRRQGTINLKGKKTGEVKRRSSTYGNTFASFGADTAMALPEREPNESMSPLGVTAADQDFGDDDLLDGFDDDDLFGGGDDAVDLGLFGFDGE